jgi:hypothetical protein
MKPNIRAILERCINEGLDYGYNRAHKHTNTPTRAVMLDEMEQAVWHEINEYFIFENEEL